MTRYERLTLSLRDNVIDVEGRIISVLAAPRAGRSKITALVEMDETTTTTTPTPDAGDTVDEKTTFYCIGKKADDSRCTREVEEPGERCWQHPDD